MASARAFQNHEPSLHSHRDASVIRELKSCHSSLRGLHNLIAGQQSQRVAEKYADPKLRAFEQDMITAQQALDRTRQNLFKLSMHKGAKFVPMHSRSIVTLNEKNLSSKNETNIKVIKDTLKAHAKLSQTTQDTNLEVLRRRYKFETKRLKQIQNEMGEYNKKFVSSIDGAINAQSHTAILSAHNAQLNLMYQRSEYRRTKSTDEYEAFKHKNVLQFHSLTNKIQIDHVDTLECVWRDELTAAQKDKENRKAKQWSDDWREPDDAKDGQERADDAIVMADHADRDDAKNFEYSAADALLPELHQIKFSRYDQKVKVVEMLGNAHDKFALNKERSSRKKETERQIEKSKSRKGKTYVVPQNRQNRGRGANRKRQRGSRGRGRGRGKRPHNGNQQSDRARSNRPRGRNRSHKNERGRGRGRGSRRGRDARNGSNRRAWRS